MSRMSARYIAPKMGMSTSSVYNTWEKMGLVMKNKYGDWTLTNLGMDIGGRMSRSNYLSVPTFELEPILKLMREFFAKTKNK